VLWSVIAGAFIGPGTITTAASAGAGFGLALIWALLFSTVACLVLQEASARLTVLTGEELGLILRRRAGSGPAAIAMVVLILGAVVLGCAAYQAGNILGGVVGAVRLTGLPSWSLTLGLGLGAGTLLWFGRTRLIALLFGFLVAVMGVTFLVTAIGIGPEIGGLLRGALVPTVPAGSVLLVVGLIGTTVVPYNLFLGSGLARGQDLRGVRFGLPLAIGVGGLISIAVLVTGTAVSGDFTFDALARILEGRLGPWAGSLLSAGLFAAGFSSALSAPWAAAITARGLLRAGDGEEWSREGWRYRSVWIAVLLTGVGFGLTGVRPVPAIILAQVLNGILLPIVAVFLLVAANDRKIVGAGGLSSLAHTILMTGIVLVTMLLGLANVLRAVWRMLGLAADEGGLLIASGVVVVSAAAPLVRAVRRARMGA